MCEYCFVILIIVIALFLLHNNINKEKYNIFRQYNNKSFLETLMLGNQYFVNNVDKKKLEKLSNKQSPKAIIITCSDSRVEPSRIFNSDIGDFFIIRAAGNVIDMHKIGSIEYALLSLGVVNIVILGHTKCGAIKESMKNVNTESNNINSILNEIRPSLIQCMRKFNIDNEYILHTINDNSKEFNDISECVIEYNIFNTAKKMLSNSSIITKLLDEKKINIYYMKYDLDIGKVSVLSE